MKLSGQLYKVTNIHGEDKYRLQVKYHYVISFLF